MLLVLLALQLVLLLAVIALYLRKPPAPVQDPRQLQLPDQLTRLEAQFERQLAQIRSDLGQEAATTRAANDHAAAALRAEVLSTISTLTQTLTSGLEMFRIDNAASANALRDAVQTTLDTLTQRFISFSSEATRTQLEAQTALHGKLTELEGTNTALQDKLRASVEASLNKLNLDNEAKLEQMRLTVDEKLHQTLQTRLTDSFGQVATHLGEVQKGLGEMKELATGVGDLKKVLSNVKSRGIVGEFLLGQQLEQMFSPEQYIKNARIKRNTTESVEYALKFPNGEGPGGYALLPIDAKFPKEDWERLEHAYDHGTPDEIAAAGKAFERAIRTQGKTICEKYIDPPTTLPHGIMFLPTENLYAEVVRRSGLQAEIQTSCRVTIVGPSTLMAILTSFQMGFQSLKLEKKGHEIRNILAQAKTQFGKFGDLLGTMETHIGRAQGTLQDLGVRSRAITKALKNVEEMESQPEESEKLLSFDEFPGVAPLLAATSNEAD
jgi:DNA recombination protein RmuC